MADKTPTEPGSKAPFATRIDPIKAGLSLEQMHFIKQVEMDQWKKKTVRLRGRNAATGLAIGALVLGICILLLASTQGSVSCLRAISSGTQSITAELAMTSKIPH